MTTPAQQAAEKIESLCCSYGYDVMYFDATKCAEIIDAATAELRATNERYRQALSDIKKHQEVIAPSMANMTAAWQIANKALTAGK